jgi:AraC-like DNA-binding protein
LKATHFNIIFVNHNCYKMKLEIENNSVDTTQKEFSNYYVILISVMFFFNAFWEYYLDFRLASLLNVIALVLSLQNLFLISIGKFSFDKIFNLTTILMTLYYYARVLMFWQILPIIYFSIFQLPIATIFVNHIRTSILYTLFLVFLIITAPYVSSILELNYNTPINSTQYSITNISIIVFGITKTLLVLFYLNLLNKKKNISKVSLDDNYNELINNISSDNDKEINLSKNKNLNSNLFVNTPSNSTTSYNRKTENNTISENRNAKEEENEEENKEITISDEKVNEIFSAIENFMKEKEPFKDPSFNSKFLASELKTNITYIAKILSIKKGMNFKTYINTFRIEMIKVRLNNKEHEKYNLRHIYNDAGFSYQSTFNRVFKEIEGITPSEYIEKLN